MWTLEYNGVEKALGDWGIGADFERERANKQKGIFRCRTVEGFDAGGPQFAYRQPLTVWRDRDRIGSGGAIFFQGFWASPKQCIEGSRQWFEYVAFDVWWLLERQTFMQTRKQFSGTAGHVPTGVFQYLDVLCPEVYLGELLNSEGELLLQSNGEQIGEIVGWANECFNPTKRGATSGRNDAQDIVQLGTVDPKSLIAVERASGLYCSEAMTRVLRLSPDALIRIDHTTTPPTLHVRTFGKWNYETNPPTFIDYTNLPEVVINITADQERQIWVQAQHDQQSAGVAIYYRWITEVDGVRAPQLWVDKFPGTITDYTPEVSRHLIELAGASVMHVRAAVEVNDAFPPSLLAGDAEDLKAWFLAHDKTLSDPKVDPASIVVGTVSVVDRAGNAVNLATYPNELLQESSLPNWTGKTVVPAVVVAEIAFNKYADAGHTIPDVKKTAHVVRQSVNLTDATTKVYVTVSHADSGESAPGGVAEQAYRGLAALQHAVGVTFTKGQLRSDIDVGSRLRLVGPTTTFANILVQTMTERPHYGETVVNGGALPAVDIDALIMLARATRFRTIYNMPSGRANGGTAGTGGEVDTGAKPGLDNTAHGIGGEKFHGVTFQQS